MPLSAEERRFIEDIRARHDPDDEAIRLIEIIERITPTIFSVGDRVMAINYKGERLGRGRVTASQRENGFYMRVKVDNGPEVVVPQGMSKRLLLKK